jgi:hypothetical protein
MRMEQDSTEQRVRLLRVFQRGGDFERVAFERLESGDD